VDSPAIADPAAAMLPPQEVPTVSQGPSEPAVAATGDLVDKLTGAADVALVKALGAGQDSVNWGEFRVEGTGFVSGWLVDAGVEQVMVPSVAENVMDSVLVSLDSFTRLAAEQGGGWDVPDEVVLIPLKRALATFTGLQTTV
jgi:hypothetical protein